MATELAVQSERAYQKQPHIFLNNKQASKSKAVGKGGRRWFKDVGLGFRTPATAINGDYIGMRRIPSACLLGNLFAGANVQKIQDWRANAANL